jgi:hypothetical protein
MIMLIGMIALVINLEWNKTHEKRTIVNLHPIKLLVNIKNVTFANVTSGYETNTTINSNENSVKYLKT